MRTLLVVLLAAPLSIACTGSIQANVSAKAGTEASAPASSPSAEEPPSTDSSQSITIHYAPPRVGATITRKRENKLTAHVGPGKGNTLVGRSISERTIKVLAVSGERIDKIEVRFVTEESTFSAGKKKTQSLHLPIAGRTFVLARGTVRPQVFAAEGVPASPKDSALVAQLVPRIDPDEGLENGGFPTGSITVGERVPSLERAIASDLARKSGNASVRSVSVTLVELRDGSSGREAVFAFDLAWSLVMAELSLDERLTGTMICRADGRLVSMSAKGPAVIEGPLGRAEGFEEMTVTETDS